jgi:putative effector of murein hydrolase
MKLSLGRAHELGLCVSLTASILIVLLGGEFPPWAWIGAFAPVLSMMLRRRNVTAPGSSGTLLGLAAVAAGVATLLRSGVEAGSLSTRALGSTSPLSADEPLVRARLNRSVSFLVRVVRRESTTTPER